MAHLFLLDTQFAVGATKRSLKLSLHHFPPFTIITTTFINIMPRSSSEESDQQSLLSQDPVELGLQEKLSLPPPSPPSRFRQFLLSFCNKTRLVVFITIVGAISVLALTAIIQPHSQSVSSSSNHCGFSAEEALALGCQFDILNYAWQPPECFDQDIYDRYWAKSQEHGPLKWYADARLTHELPQDIELLMHTPFVWTEHRFHVVHCMYAWELLHHALTLGRPVMEFISTMNHTQHCADTALNEDWEAEKTSIKASYNRCVWLA